MNPNNITNIMLTTDTGFFPAAASSSATKVLDHLEDLDNKPEGLNNKLASELTSAFMAQVEPSAEILLVFPFNTSQLNNAYSPSNTINLLEG